MPPMQFPDFSVAGRVALITGSGRGIGLGLAKALAAGGAAVAIQDIDEHVAKKEADAINAAGGRAIALGGDLADLELPERLVEQTAAAFGPVSILINNASIQYRLDFGEHTVEQMRRTFDVNMTSAVRLCQLVLPNMREARWGRIINFGSVQGKGGFLGMAPYAMTRAAMPNLTTSMGKTYAREGITVNCIAPGWFDTYRNDSETTPKERKVEMGKHVPIGRLGEPEDCAGLCVLLCSRAGEYITGQTIYVEGAMSL